MNKLSRGYLFVLNLCLSISYSLCGAQVHTVLEASAHKIGFSAEASYHTRCLNLSEGMSELTMSSPTLFPAISQSSIEVLARPGLALNEKVADRATSGPCRGILLS